MNKPYFIPLLSAILTGNIERLRRLWDTQSQSIDINAPYGSGITALMTAIDEGHIEIVKYLCSIDSVDANATDNRGITALMIAACSGSIECVRVLCSIRRIDVNFRDKRESTAFLHAAMNGHSECAQYLFDLKCFNKTDPRDKIIACALQGKLDIVKESLLSLDLGGNFLEVLLVMASANGHVKCIDFLLHYGADVNGCDWCPKTPLMLSSMNGHNECVRLLLNVEKVDAIRCDQNGCTALMLAAMNGHVECMNVLLRLKSVPVNTSDIHKRTALMLAAMNGHCECIDTLLHFKSVSANNASDVNKRTALMYAAMNGHAECVRSLITNRAVDVWVKDDDGMTAFQLAIRNGHVNCLRLFVDIEVVEDVAKDKFHIKEREDVENDNFHIKEREDVENDTFHIKEREDVVKDNFHIKEREDVVKDNFHIKEREDVVKDNFHIKEREDVVNDKFHIKVRQDDADDIKQHRMGTSLLPAFRSQANGISTRYRPGITRKRPSCVKGHQHEDIVFDVVVRNGLRLCPFYFVLAERDSKNSLCGGGELDIESVNEICLDREHTYLKLAIESGQRKCLEYVFRYHRLLLHILLDLLFYCASNAIDLNNRRSLRRDLCRCDTCTSYLEGREGVRQIYCVKHSLSYNIAMGFQYSFNATPLQLAVYGEHHKCTKCLVEHIDMRHKTCDAIRLAFCNAPEKQNIFKYLAIFLKKEIFDWSWYSDFPQRKVRYLARELVIRGYSPGVFKWRGKWSSPLQHALSINDNELVKYLVANLYLTSSDLKLLQYNTQSYVHQNVPNDTQRLQQQLSSKLWSLQALSFLTVSFAVKCKRRNPDMMQNIIPGNFQKRLTFRNPIAMLCVKQWESIRLAFDVKDVVAYTWPYDGFLMLGGKMVEPETDILRFGQCCNGKCRPIKQNIFIELKYS